MLQINDLHCCFNKSNIDDSIKKYHSIQKVIPSDIESNSLLVLLTKIKSSIINISPYPKVSFLSFKCCLGMMRLSTLY
jgi:hypothetical protein